MPKKTKQKPRSQVISEMRLRHSTASNVVVQLRQARGQPTKPDAARDKRLAKLIADLSKKYKGEQVLTTIANGSRQTNVKGVPSGWQGLDDLVTGETDKDGRTIPGTGLGWPRGRIIEVYGDEGVGKTTLALHIIAAVQALGEECAFIDAEHALDVGYAAKLGVDMTRLQLSQPDAGGDRAMEVVHRLCSSGLFGCVVVDSVAALEPASEMEKDLDESAQPAEQARLMSRALRKLTSPVAKHGVLLVFINQMRMKIGVRFGNPKTTSGGNALKFYASVRMEMVNVKTMKKGDRVIGKRIRIRTVKNKAAPPFRDLFVDVKPNVGIAEVHTDPDLGGGDGD